MRAYSLVLDGQSLTAAITTLIEMTAAAAKSYILTRAWISQRSNTTSQQQSVQILRRTTVSTNVATPLSNPYDAGDSAFAGTVRGLATVLGGAGAVLYSDSFNWQNGWLWLPVPEERIFLPGAGILALHLPVAPPALTVSCGIDILEIG
jgi:hypothetical protein